MSIVRIGLAETKNFSEGWEAIFGGKKEEKEEPKKGKKEPEAKAEAKPAKAKKKPAKKK